MVKQKQEEEEEVCDAAEWVVGVEVFDDVALEVFECALEEVYCYNEAAAEEGSFVDGAVVEVDEGVCAVVVEEGEVVDGNCHREHVQEDIGISLVAEVLLNFATYMSICKYSPFTAIDPLTAE